MLEEFKKFIMRGNVVDLAVGVIIGLAFGAIVTSLVNDIIMPIIGAITGGLDFTNYYLPLSTKVEPGLAYVDAKKQGAVLGWGQFLTVALNFVIIAAVLFLAIKGMNKLKREEPRVGNRLAIGSSGAQHRFKKLAFGFNCCPRCLSQTLSTASVNLNVSGRPPPHGA